MTGRFLKNLRKKFQDELAHANSTAEESISNIITVRSFSNESKMVDMYSDDIDKSYYLGRKLALLIGVFMGVVSMFMYVSCVNHVASFPSLEHVFHTQGAASLVLWYGGYLVFHGSINPGTLISLMLYTLNLAMCFAFLANVYGEFMQVLKYNVPALLSYLRKCHLYY